MKKNISTKFYLNTEKGNGPKYPLYLRFTIDRASTKRSIGFSLTPKEWNAEKEEAKLLIPNQYIINESGNYSYTGPQLTINFIPIIFNIINFFNKNPDKSSPSGALIARSFDSSNNVINAYSIPVSNQNWTEIKVTYPILDEREVKVEVFLASRPGNTTFYDNVSIQMKRNIPKIIQENHYTPFGLNIRGLEFVDGLDTNHFQLFGGKELVLRNKLGLNDFGARWLDPQLGRFLSVDPLAHMRGGWTPYNAFRCNPILNVDPTGALDKEYETEADYKKENPNGKLDGSDGHWLKSDRENKTTTWDNANTTNLQANRHDDYTTITQRADFYGWYAGKISSRGFDNNWPGAAYIVAGQMSNLDDSRVAWWVGPDVVKFGNEGNKAIFNDVFDNLKDLYNGSVMKGQAAANWDASTLYNEQFIVVQPIYMKQTAATLSTLSQMAKGQGLYGLGVTGTLRFEGNVLNPQDRYNHGAGKVTKFFNLQKTYWKLGW